MEELIQGIQQRVATLPQEGQTLLKNMYGTDQLKLVGYIIGPEITSAIAGSINQMVSAEAQPQQVPQPMPTPQGLGARPQR
jgi:hypothetical protein|tara:strand:+ start:476 stop:718 length:243 start_codon:yes stop_codon:yes gene_type:complete